MIPKLEVGTILVATRNFKAFGINFKILKGKRYEVEGFSYDISNYDEMFEITNELGIELSLPYSFVDSRSKYYTFMTLEQERKAKLESILLC